MPDRLRDLIAQWRNDPSATYQTWFLWDERLKNFRSIRRGIGQVVEEIETGRFGVAYRGSSLETIVHSVAEQRQIFKGADHAFLWKPKLRIPDIYLRNVNSGHPGSITTVHADSAALAFEQLTLLVRESEGGRDLPREDIRALLHLLVDVVVQMKKVDGRFRVTEVWHDPVRKRQPGD